MTKEIKFTIQKFVIATVLVVATTGCAGTGDTRLQVETDRQNELPLLVENLERNEVLVVTGNSQTEIDGFAVENPVDFVWPCIWDGSFGGGAGFVGCTQLLVDTGGCAIVVAHEDGYCSKPCASNRPIDPNLFLVSQANIE